MNESMAIAITEQSQTGEARRASLALATRLGFEETERGKVGLLVTEVANNLIRHAGRGTIVLRAIAQDDVIGIEVLGLDQGSGMVDVEECLQDGFSTAGTSGNGLGAIRRLSDLFDIYSQPNKGTALLAHIWAKTSAHSPPKIIEIGVVALPKLSEEVSGDAWAWDGDDHRGLFMVVDGLGHGPAAASAASAAIRVFHDHHHQSPQRIIEAAHAALRSTRGAALAIAEINFEQQTVCFAGIGNIAASVSSATEHHNMMSYNGTVGHEVRKIKEFTYPWYLNGLLTMHSDGISTQWNLDRYPGLSQKHPSLIAGVLHRDFHRERDDVTMLVAKGTGA
ncbi:MULTISPECIES: ATP-binding SpoIIE family protein phosphatase [Cyanophyceae]|uniref:ATP-binding SpoIIE family protein phosphatase n=1 Tax=Cyanophyceae TaxID=3028117 RepID=UPI001683CB3D|nr:MULTISPECIES: ATP-binding SpoIIE family protein phosphatase [Cyanophyceae]MBD1918094.1 SpoIIE family protein phosphatase [Phormidium sp. FACHB-77]MBD2030126.1 SpoIIE family protein phosphatase [Phormidium sp. FACHB-322]MBD2051502.1 SpoIIE family protein phosphatase [Leptolyngbya sp. FACHB-60]